MTYRQLRKRLQEMDELKLDDTATVYDRTNDEYLEVVSTKITDDTCDVLDEDHLIMLLECRT